MNLRQKAKKYKKLYERTKQQPVNFQVHNFKTSILKSAVFVPYEMTKTLETNELGEVEVIKTKLARGLEEELKKTMDISVDYYPSEGVYKVYGTVRVVTGIYY